MKNHDWKLYNAFSSLISQVNLNIVFKMVLSSSSPINLKIMANHGKWSKKETFEKKNNFTLKNRHFCREKLIKYQIFSKLYLNWHKIIVNHAKCSQNMGNYSILY